MILERITEHDLAVQRMKWNNKASFVNYVNFAILKFHP